MDPSLQRVVLLPLAALVPVVAYVSARADLVAVITAVNVFLIWISLRVATGGSPQPGGTDAGSTGSPVDGGER